MTLSQFPQFKRLSRKDRPAIESFTSCYEPYSDFSFTSLWSWDVSGEVEWCVLNHNLVVKLPSYGNPITSRFSVLGTTDISATIQTLLTTEVVGGHLQLVPQLVIDNIGRDHRFVVQEDVDDADYVIDIESFLGRAGHIYANTRKKLNSFSRRIPSVIELDLRDRDSLNFVHVIFEEWLASHDSSDEAMARKFDVEATAITRALGLGDGVRCIGIRLNRKPYAFQIFDHIDRDWCIFHFAKAAGSFHGCSEYLMDAVFASCRASGAKYCNEEPDLGVSGLRIAKRQHHPSRFLRKYSIRLDIGSTEVGARATPLRRTLSGSAFSA